MNTPLENPPLEKPRLENPPLEKPRLERQICRQYQDKCDPIKEYNSSFCDMTPLIAESKTATRESKEALSTGSVYWKPLFWSNNTTNEYLVSNNRDSLIEWVKTNFIPIKDINV